VPESALFGAVVDGRRARVERMLERGADPNARSLIEDGALLAVAAAHGHGEIVSVLLDAGAEINAASGRQQDTALHRATCAGERSTVRVLLDRGALPDVRDGAGATPLSCAGGATRDLLERAMRAYGHDLERDSARPPASRIGPELEAGASEQDEHVPLPPLLEASWANDVRRMAALLGPESLEQVATAGQRLGGLPVVPGSSALHVASEWGRFNAVGLLLSAGAEVDAADEHGRTALHVAMWRGRHSVALGLLSAGADPSLRDETGLTPMDYAAWHGDREAIEAMRETATEAARLAAAQTAASRGHLDIVTSLWPSDQDVRPLLERAIHGDHWELLLALLERQEGVASLGELSELAIGAGSEGSMAILSFRDASGAPKDGREPVAPALAPAAEDTTLDALEDALDRGELDRAYAGLVELEQRVPWMPRLQRLLGAHALAEGDVETAIEHYRLALRLDPSDGQAAQWLDAHGPGSNEEGDP